MGKDIRKHSMDEINKVFESTEDKFKTKIDEEKEGDGWISELHESVVEEVAQIVDGVFGPGGYDMPSQDKVVQILKDAMDDVFAE